MEGKTKGQDLYSRLETEDADEIRLCVILQGEIEETGARPEMSSSLCRDEHHSADAKSRRVFSNALLLI